MPGRRGPDAWDGHALFMAVSGMAGLSQAALPDNKDKINTDDCTGS